MGNKYYIKDVVTVNKSEILDMLHARHMTVGDLAEQMRMMDGPGCCRTTLYNWLKDGVMPRVMANKMMDCIWEGHPPFYYLGKAVPDKQIDPEPMPIFPSYATDLIQAQFYLNRAIKKMNDIERKRAQNGG